MRRPTPPTLIAIAVMGAVGFVVLRILYRGVFGGASSGDTVLLSAPRLRLSGPLSHIVLFGPITLEGLTQAAMSALPFALVILAIGVVMALVDVRSLVFLIPRLRLGKRTFVALVIALSTLPALVETAKRTQYFATVRGISRKRILFVPFLEKTLERSVGIAKALHTRGVFSRLPRDSAESGVVVKCRNFAIPSRGVKDVSWGLSEGSMTLLTGETGAGKTSFLDAIAGVLEYPHAVPTSGSLVVSHDPSSVAYVPHDPQSLFLAGNVRDEIALGLVLRGMSRVEAHSLANRELERWGLSELSARHPAELSEGESVLVAIIAALVLKPRLLLVDEPLAVLDRARRTRLTAELDTYSAATQATVLMTDHGHITPGSWPGNVIQLGPRGVEDGPWVSPPADFPARRDVHGPEADVVLQVEGIEAFRGKKRLFQDVAIEIRRGHSVVVIGDNGVGKTTLLQTLFDACDSDPSRFSYVPTDPAEMFVAETLGEELAYTDRAQKLPHGFTLATLHSLLPGSWRHDVLERAQGTHPRDLSRGLQTAVAIAVQMSQKPLVLALDEPTRGLDSGAREALAEVLACVKETGTAILSASHDDDFVAGRHDHVLRLAEGSLLSVDGGDLHAEHRHP